MSSDTNSFLSFRRPFEEVRERCPDEDPSNPVFLERIGAEPLPNGQGFSFLVSDDAVKAWISSLPESDKPLLDLGAGLGYQTILALKASRNVIAVDMSKDHLSEITARSVNEQIPDVTLKLKCIQSTLPDSNIVEKESVAGILMSELAFCLKPGELRQLFKDAQSWLVPGGVLALTSCSCAGLRFVLAMGATVPGNRTTKEVWSFLETSNDEQIAQEAPTFVAFKEEYISNFRSLYLLSCQELAAHARISGFEIIHLDYFNAEKYPTRALAKDECIMLIAKKL